ncbi:MAG: hypothetical protein RR609_09080, partial [Aurantimicrobium sp.]
YTTAGGSFGASMCTEGTTVAISHFPQEPVISAHGNPWRTTASSAVRPNGYTSSVDAPVSC